MPFSQLIGYYLFKLFKADSMSKFLCNLPLKAVINTMFNILLFLLISLVLVLICYRKYLCLWSHHGLGSIFNRMLSHSGFQNILKLGRNSLVSLARRIFIRVLCTRDDTWKTKCPQILDLLPIGRDMAVFKYSPFRIGAVLANSCGI